MSFITENPLWAYVLLAAAGVVFVSAFVVTKRVVYLAAVPVVLVLGLGFWLIDYAIETDREQVERKTRELAAAVEAGDLNKLDALISKRFYHPMFASKQALLDRARGVLQPGQQRTCQLWQFETSAGGSGKTMILTGNASASGQYGSFNVPGFLGKVEFTFLKDDDGQWRLGKFLVTDTQGNDVAIPR